MDRRTSGNRRAPQRTTSARPAPRKRRKGKDPSRYAGWIILAVVAVIAIYVIHMLSVLGVGTPRFYKGVYVLGMDLSGYTYPEGQQLMQEKVDEWKNRTFTFTYQERSWSMSVSDIGGDLDVSMPLVQAWNLGHTGSVFDRMDQIQSLKQHPVYLTCEPTYDQEAMDAFIEGIRAEIDQEAVDAEVVLTADRPVLQTRSSIGYQLDTEAFEAQVMELLKTGTDMQAEALKVTTLKPAVDSETAEGGLELVAESITSTEKSSYNRLKNVARALNQFNAWALYPGQTVSFNEMVGKRTIENGFFEAPEYDGTEVLTGIGGGTCQASSTLYKALLQIGIQIDVRSHHSMTVGYTEPSFDATVSDAKRDLVFTNNTNRTFYFYTLVDSEEARVMVYSNPLEYKIVLESVVYEKDIVSKKIRYEDDTEGKFVYYTDETALKEEGKKGVKSKCIRHYYDVNTGELIRSEEVSNDYYSAQPDTYWRGVHKRES